MPGVKPAWRGSRVSLALFFDWRRGLTDIALFLKDFYMLFNHSPPFLASGLTH
jgi:hypothetical protein